MQILESIHNKISSNYTISHYELLNESHMHAGPATDSHFKLILVSPDFTGLSLVKRHQSVYKVLAEELAGAVHALALHTHTDTEWSELENTVPKSPQCLGGE